MTEFSPEDIQVSGRLVSSVRKEYNEKPRVRLRHTKEAYCYDLMSMTETYIEAVRKGYFAEDAEFALYKAIRLGGIVKLLIDTLNIEAIKEKETHNDAK